MDTLTCAPKIIGFYCSDSEELYNRASLRVHMEERYLGYLPVIDLLTINQASEVRFTDTSNKNAEVTTYDRSSSGKRLDEPTVRSKRIDITQNDLFVGPINLALNFTSKPVTVGLPGELRKTFSRITNDKFSEQTGKFLILTIYTLNSPSFIYDTHGASNYLESMGNVLENKTDEMSSTHRSIYRYAETKWTTFKRQNCGLMANSVKVVVLREVFEEHLDKGKQSLIPGLNWVIGQTDILSLNNNPLSELNTIGSRGVKDAFDKNSVLCYIVDNEDHISDRYTNIAGHVHAIPKLKNRAMPDGLYLLKVGNSGERTNDLYCSLAEIDDNVYVYKSKEEANNGANLRQQYKDDLDLAKAALEQMKIDAGTTSVTVKTDSELETIKRKSEQDRVKAEYEEKKLALDHERDRLKSEVDRYRNEQERYTARSKHNYESERYERDTFVESIKTVGATAGAMAALFLVYKKFA